MSLEPPELSSKFDWWNIRSALSEWFFRFHRSQFLVPPGATVPFPFSTPPDGWVLTDGTDYDETKFPNLFAVLGANGAAAGFMRVPTIPPDGYGTWMIKV